MSASQGASEKGAQFDKASVSVKKITNTTQSKQVSTLAVTPIAPLVRAGVIARHFDVHPRTVALWAKNGTIPCTWIGGALRFNMEAVLGAVR